MRKREKYDLVLVLLWPIVAAIVSLVFKLNFIGSILIFYFIPSLFLSFRIKDEIGKAFIFSLLGIPIYILVETIGNVSNAWVVPTLFSFRLFGTSIEGALWGFFAIYLAVMFYEYFLDHHVTKKLYSRNLKYFIVLVFAGFARILNRFRVLTSD